MDFTLKMYGRLIETIQKEGYNFCTFKDFCAGKVSGKTVILRHDVDNKPKNSLNVSMLEKSLNIRSTYYFQIKKHIFKPEIIQKIAELGHEIGYHYNDLVDSHGNTEKAIYSFQTNLSVFRRYVNVETIAMHGSPTSQWDNRDIWKKYNYRNFGLIGEPYFDFVLSELTKEEIKMLYITDTGRMWNGSKYNMRDKINMEIEDDIDGVKNNNPIIHSTFDFINWLKLGNTPDIILITTHPQRWTNNKFDWLLELVLQRIKNFVKGLILKRR